MAIGGLDIGSLFGRVSLEDAFSGVLEKIEGKLGSFGSDISGFGEKLKEGFESPLAFAKEHALAFAEELGPLGLAAGGAAVVVGALGVGMFELAHNAAEAGEEIERFSHVTGMAAEEVSNLKAVADIGGSSLGALQGMLFQTEKRLQATGEAGQKVDHALEDMKISAEEFRNAAPEEKIKLLSEGLHNAQGSATMMADAMAVMGRGARENIPFLLKNFDELEERASRVAYIWSEEDVEAAERLDQQVKELKEGLSTVSTEIGVALIPAMTGLVAGIEKLGTVLYTVSGIEGWVEAFRALKGVLGEDELAIQTQAALTDMMGRRWAEAKKEGLGLDEAAYKIAEDMLKAGYSIKTVAEQTGLAQAEVNKMKGEMDSAAKAAISQAESWDRINEAFAGFSDIPPAVRGLVKDMLDAKVSVEDMAAATGLSKEQLKGLTEQLKEGEKAEKDFNKAWENLNSMGASVKDTFDTIDDSIKAEVLGYAKLGASVKDLTAAYPGLTEQQAKAAEQMVKQAEAEAKAADALGKLWETYYQKKAELVATDEEKITIKAEAEYEARVKQAQDMGIVDQKYYDDLWALRSADIDLAKEQYDKEAQSKLAADLKMRDSENQVEEALKQHMQVRTNAHNSNQTETGKDIKVVETLAEAWDKVSKGVSATTIKVKTLGGELISLEEAQKRFDMGNSITYDLTTQAGIDFYRKMNPAAQINWSDKQIIDAAKKGATLAALIAIGAISPYAHMGHAALGGTVTVGEHGPELVTLPEGSTIYPHGSTPTGVGGGSLVLNFNVYGNTVQQVQQIKDHLMREIKLHKQFSSATF